MLCDLQVARAAASRSGGPLARDTRSRAPQAATRPLAQKFMLNHTIKTKLPNQRTERKIAKHFPANRTIFIPAVRKNRRHKPHTTRYAKIGNKYERNRLHFCSFAENRSKSMVIELIVVGKTVGAWLESGIREYTGRLGHYTRFIQTVIPELKNARNLREEQIKATEGELILDKLSPGDHVVLLDENGQLPGGSVAFADRLQSLMNRGTRKLVFVIGGAYGFSASVYARADEKLSLSPMTFSHQMVRLIFAEQLYRAFTILRGEPYHHR